MHRLARLLTLATVLLLPGLWQPLAAQPKIERVTTALGIEAWLVREPSIPMIALEAAWRDAGWAAEPAERGGLARILATMLTEGAGELDSQAYQVRLEELAVSVSFSADRDEFRGSLRTLTRNREEAFRLFGEALARPRMDSEPLERRRQQALIRLSREQEEPGSIGSRALFAAAFPDHPYGRNPSGTPESLKALSAADLDSFRQRHLGRDNLVIGVVGDIDADELRRLLEATFAGLPAKRVQVSIPDIAPALDAKPIVIPRDMPQSQVQFIGAGIGRDDPDFYAAFVMNYVLGGGGFNSRLMEEVREKRGLAYSVNAYLAPMRHSAIHIGSFGTQNERAAEALDVVRRELRRMRDEGMSEQELQNAKTYLNGSFPLQLSSNSRIAGMLLRMQIDRLGIDYVEKRPGHIDAVTLEDIRRVARRLLDPDNLLVVVVGKPVGIGG
ncbi:MAG: insulinase family protein [Alphaproteobacteria bacterium]|nr:insulinase family protein [Alphaproteobacteria bacterium]